MDFGGMDYQGGGGFGGGFGGGGGGGFVDSGGYGGGGDFSTAPPAGGPSSPPPSSNSNRRRSQEEQTLLPVTASMILKATADTNGVVLADGRSLHHVKLVGAIRAFESHSTNTLFQVEDGTGVLDVKQWNDTNACAKALEMHEAVKKQHIYVAIYGEVKDYDGKKTLVAASVRPIATGNELTHHMLEVIFQGEKHKKGNTASAPPTMQGVGFGAAPSRAPIQMQTGGSNLGDTLIGLIRDKGDMNGLSISAMVSLLGGKHDQGEIRQTLVSLSHDGLLYTSTDDETYMCC